MREEFRRCLVDSDGVCAGKSLHDVSIFLVGHECFSALSDADRNAIYDQHQQSLRVRARAGFRELLFEQAERLCRFEGRSISESDVNDFIEEIKRDARYQALRCLSKERQMLLIEHLGFIYAPSKNACPLQNMCVNRLLQQVLFTKAKRSVPGSRLHVKEGYRGFFNEEGYVVCFSRFKVEVGRSGLTA